MKDFDFMPREKVRGIGSTDARRIAAGDWASLYDEKHGDIEPADLRFVWKAQLGLTTEKLHAWWHAHVTKDTLIEPPLAASGKSMVILKKAYRDAVPAFTSIDRWVEADNCPLELKHTYGGNTLRAAADFYMAQLQWQMIVTGADRLRFSVICGNEEPQWAYVEYDADYAMRLWKQAVAFWQMVENHIRPEDTSADAELTAKAPTIKVGGTRAYDWSKQNEWVDRAQTYIILKPKADDFKENEKELRALIPDDASEITGGGLIVKRDKRGACRITVAAPLG